MISIKQLSFGNPSGGNMFWLKGRDRREYLDPERRVSDRFNAQVDEKGCSEQGRQFQANCTQSEVAIGTAQLSTDLFLMHVFNGWIHQQEASGSGSGSTYTKRLRSAGYESLTDVAGSESPTLAGETERRGRNLSEHRLFRDGSLGPAGHGPSGLDDRRSGTTDGTVPGRRTLDRQGIVRGTDARPAETAGSLAKPRRPVTGTGATQSVVTKTSRPGVLRGTGASVRVPPVLPPDSSPGSAQSAPGGLTRRPRGSTGLRA